MGRAASRERVLGRRVLALAGVAWLLLMVAPLVMGSYALYVLAIGCVMAIATIGLDLTAGVSGQLSLGHAGFFGIGAYAAAVCIVRADLPPWLAVPAAVVVAGLAGGLVGLPLTRLRGHYLAMATLAFGLIVFDLSYTLRSITNGGAGLTVPVAAHFDTTFRVLALFAVATLLGALALRESWAGLTWELLRDSEPAAASVGVNVPLWKLFAVMAGAAVAGLAGGLYVLVVNYVSPEPFGLATTIFFFAAMLIGGPGTIWGPAIAALCLNGITYALGNLLGLQEMLYGLIILLVLWLFPRGVARGMAVRLVAARIRPRA